MPKISTPVAPLVVALATLLLGSTASAQEGRGCSVFKPCPKGFKCEAGSQKCRGPGKEGDPCHLTRPCGPGLKCEAGSQRCRGPGKEGDSCHLTRPCGPGLTCEAGSHRCRRPGGVGDSCHATRPCGSGLSCQPGVHKCYHQPRHAGEPCVAGHGCQPGFYCQSFVHKCVPKSIDFKSNSPCAALRVHAIAEDAKRARMTMTFSSGSTAGAGAYFSYETGLVYGDNGEFGCFATACVGSQADANVANFANFGIYGKYKDFEGFSAVTGGSADTPFINLGFATSQVWSANAPNKPKEILKGRLLGTASGLTFGVGLNPVSVNTALCYTARLDSGKPLSNFKDIQKILKGWSDAGFTKSSQPASLGGSGGGSNAGGGGNGGGGSNGGGGGNNGGIGARCASENQRCNFSGKAVVRYGANGKFVSRVAVGGIDCNNKTFGDPIYGVVKACYVKPIGGGGGGGGSPSDACVATEHANFQGRSQAFSLGNHDIGTLHGKVGNDQISAVRCRPGFEAILFEHGGFKGQKLVVRGARGWVGNGFNDKASSIIVRRY